MSSDAGPAAVGTTTTAAPPRGTAPSARRRGGLHRHEGPWALLFIAPLMLGVIVFYLWPIVRTFVNSFTEIGVFGGAEFSGLENYRTLVTDSQVPLAILNTLIYTAIVMCGIPVAVYIASLLNRPGLRFAWLYRTMFFLPNVAMPVAIALVWRMIYNSNFGILNYLLSLVGIQGPYWISSPGWALVSVSVLGLWASLGLAIIILSAGLRGIPQELYEAAQLDGAGVMRQFRSITVPLLTPSIFFLSIITAISGFQVFDLLYALLGETNPAMAQSRSLVFLFYEQAFRQNAKGYASAIAMLILVLIGLITLLQFRLQKRWVTYV